MQSCVVLICFALVLFLTGCHPLGPGYKRPTVATPTSYKELTGGANDQWKTAMPSDGELRGKWWELFKDPKLNELEPKVSVSNETVLQAEARFRQARSFVAYNRANYYPTITVGGSASVAYATRNTSNAGNNMIAINIGGGGATGPFLGYSFPLGISWEPNLWGRVTL